MKGTPGQSIPEQARVDDEAADWLLRRSEGALGPDEEAEFERWLQAHPRHNLTFAAMSGVWAQAGALKHLGHLVDVEPKLPAHRRIQARRWIAAGIATLTAAAAGIAVFTLLRSVGAQSTGVGETRTILLSDGSSVILGAKSQIRVEYSDSGRRVQLVSGEALFDVKHDPARPFSVDVGGQVIRDLGTRFDINRSDATVRVFVLQGEVEVRDNEPAASPSTHPAVRVLKAGDGLEATFRPVTRGESDTVSYVNSSLGAPDAWRNGWLIYENASLGDVVADINRYYGPGVDLGPGVAEMRVTASIRTSQVSSFLEALNSALPVKVVRNSAGRVSVERH
jgi:transmembrane sensor